MKNKSVWHRSIWDNKIGRKVFPFVMLAAFVFFVYQGLRGLITGETLIVGKLGSTYPYHGIAGRFLGASYLCITSFVVIDMAVAYRQPRRMSPRSLKIVKVSLLTLFVVFLWSAVFFWRA